MHDGLKKSIRRSVYDFVLVWVMGFIAYTAGNRIGHNYEKNKIRDGNVKAHYEDVNEDGLKDIVLRNEEGKIYAVSLQQKDGSYQTPNEILKNEQKKLDQKYETLDNKMEELQK